MVQDSINSSTKCPQLSHLSTPVSTKNQLNYNQLTSQLRLQLPYDFSLVFLQHLIIHTSTTAIQKYSKLKFVCFYNEILHVNGMLKCPLIFTQWSESKPISNQILGQNKDYSRYPMIAGPGISEWHRRLRTQVNSFAVRGTVPLQFRARSIEQATTYDAVPILNVWTAEHRCKWHAV